MRDSKIYDISPLDIKILFGDLISIDRQNSTKYDSILENCWLPYSNVWNYDITGKWGFFKDI